MLRTIKGRVTGNIDYTSNGEFTAIFPEIGDDPVLVTFTSPVFRSGGGGAWAIPEEGDSILACHDTETDEVYYQSTILSAATVAPNTVKPIPKFKLMGDPSKYNIIGKPVQVTYQNQVGAGLCITRNYESPPSKKVVNSVTLKSEMQKRISLDDSPQSDGIHIKNQHQDGIIITGDDTPESPLPASMIQVKSRGPHEYVCMQSSLALRVIEGRDVTIENTSTGAMGQTPSQPWPNDNNAQGNNQPPKKWGGIYLRSVNGDISLASKADEGRVFIQTPKGAIQINENGDIVIEAQGKLSVYSEGDMDLGSGGAVRISGSNSVDIKSGGNITITGTGGGVLKSGGGMQIDGSTVDLKPAGATPDAADTQITDTIINDYRD